MKGKEKRTREWKGGIRLNNRDYRDRTLNVSDPEERNFNIKDEKDYIRKNLLRTRLSLSESEVEYKSDRIAPFVINLQYYKSAEKIALYYPIKNEVKTEGIFRHAREQGKKVYLPRIDGSILRYHEIYDSRSLISGKFGIFEPTLKSPEISTEDIDLVIIPGVAFDYSGARIGYGKGYYDRILKRISREKRVALGYIFQVLDKIPTTDADTSLGFVITEKGIISCVKGEGGR